MANQMRSIDSRKPFVPEDHMPLADLITTDDEPEVIINGRLVCPECAGIGCEDCTKARIPKLPILRK